MPNVQRIDFAELSDLTMIGKGSFGVVYKAQWRGCTVAVKKIDTDNELKSIRNEKVQLSRVSHPNIIQLFAECTNPVGLVIEYAEYGSLYNVLHGIKERYEYTIAHALSWALQTAKGVAFLHDMVVPILHRDLKPANLLLFDGGTVLKICDFGTVCDYHTIMTNNKGSVLWMAPEVFVSSAYDEKCDVYSWAIILWQVLTREKPFDEMKQYLSVAISWAAANGRRPRLIENCPPPIEKLMTTCWDANPKVRPSMDKVVYVMQRLCQVFPGADIPLVHADAQPEEATSNFPEEPNEGSNDGNDVPEAFPEFHGFKTNPTSTAGTLPPLNIETDPNAFTYGGISDDILVVDNQRVRDSPSKVNPSDREIAGINTTVKVEVIQPNPNASYTHQLGRQWLSPEREPSPAHATPVSFKEVTPSRNHSGNGIILPGNVSMDESRPIPPPRSTHFNKGISKVNPLPSRPPSSRLPVMHQYLSQQNLNHQDVDSPKDLVILRPKSHLPAESQAQRDGHPVAGHRRSSSYGSTLDFRDYKPENNVFLPTEHPAPPFAGIDIPRSFGNEYLMLHPAELQPIPADPDIPESLRIYEDHKQLAREYFQTISEIDKFKQHKTALEYQLSALEKEGLRPEEFSTELRRRQSENDSLVEFHKKLQEQLGRLRGDDSPVLPELYTTDGRTEVGLIPEDMNEPGFVFVSRNGTFSDDSP